MTAAPSDENDGAQGEKVTLLLRATLRPLAKRTTSKEKETSACNSCNDFFYVQLVLISILSIVLFFTIHTSKNRDASLHLACGWVISIIVVIVRIVLWRVVICLWLLLRI